ncbi:TolC family protein [Hyalangium minutum]|uniref:Heavy metal RND efflux outer membrane protein, CzcC family protein n=1 Tax=Hyalangium minutum TaxID=394096 RepID=A0A085W522_9BACT|nr:TolC family protein [Hyalangium minutum]KFE62785.1 Heavy metal RND efflux outer membrane protein, CzcC family protein [Hyalangium minutum]
MHLASIASLIIVLKSGVLAKAPEELPLKAALAEAAAKAPGVSEARAREAVAQGEVEGARTLAPLAVSLGGGWNDPHWSAGISQRLPIPGARAARVRAAEHGVHSAQGERHASEVQSRAEARRAYFSLLRATQLANTASRALAIAREAEEAAQLRFQTGAAPELDLVQARLARASAEAQLLTQQGEVGALSAELALLLGRDPRRLLQPVSGPPPRLLSLEEILSRASQAPLAQARQADILAAEATLRAARLERWPAPSLGVAAEGEGPRGASVFLRGSLDFEVPVPGLGRGELDRAEASLRVAHVLAADDRQRRLSELVAAHQRLGAALAALERFSADILPATEATERMALESYRAGRSALASLNDARRAATDTRAQAIEASFNAQAAFAALELAAGAALDEN